MAILDFQFSDIGIPPHLMATYSLCANSLYQWWYQPFQLKSCVVLTLHSVFYGGGVNQVSSPTDFLIEMGSPYIERVDTTVGTNCLWSEHLQKAAGRSGIFQKIQEKYQNFKLGVQQSLLNKSYREKYLK